MRGRWWPWLLLILALVPALLVRQPRHPVIGGVPTTENVSVAIFGNPNTLDPALASTPDDWAVDSNIFQPLFVQRPTGGLAKNLVQSYSINGKVLTLVIKPVSLSNGHTLTATMVAGALSRPLWSQVGSVSAQALLSPVSGSKLVQNGAVKYMSGVNDASGNTVTITLKHPVDRGFLKSLANPVLSIVPVGDLLRGGPEWQLTNLYGTGGYRLTNWIPNGSLTFARTRGRGPTVLALQEFGSLKSAVLAFKNGTLSAVPIRPDQVKEVPRRFLDRVRALPVPGNLFLVYRKAATRVSAYPRLSVKQWVKRSFDGSIPSLPGQWPSGMRTGKKMTVYVNQSMPEAVQLANTLARLESGRVVVQVVPAATLETLAKHNQINAYIGQADLFKSGEMMPLAPERSLWLLNSSFVHPAVFANGALDWHSLTAGK